MNTGTYREAGLLRSAGLFRSNANFIIAIAQIAKIIKLSDLYLYNIQIAHIYFLMASM